jgi:hypothetical protein
MVWAVTAAAGDAQKLWNISVARIVNTIKASAAQRV